MAKNLDIRVNVEGDNQTVSKFAAAEGGHVTFHNDAGALLTISFAGTSPVCQGSNPQLTVEVGAGSHKKLKVCNGVEGQSFKYTATVEGAAAEDPILIFDRSPILIFERELVTVAIGAAAVGAVISYLFTKRLLTRGRPQP